MPAVNRPFSARTNRGSSGLDLGKDIPHDYRRTVGAYMRGLRINRAEMTQAQVADALGVQYTAISAIEVGRVAVPPERYAAFADLYGVPHNEFARVMIRYTNPWAYLMLFGHQMAKDELTKLKGELGDLPDRGGSRAVSSQGRVIHDATHTSPHARVVKSTGIC